MSDPARRQLWQITLVRLAGVALAYLGLWLSTALPFGPPSRWLALPILLAGVALVVLAPRWIRRR